MKNLILIMIFISSCNQENKLITNNSIGYFTLGEQFSKDFDKKIFEISFNSANRIRSIIVMSDDYKTKDGFGVGANLNDIESFYKGTIKKPLTLSKGAVTIGSIGTSIIYDKIIFVDDNNDNIVDFVWIQM